MLRCDDSSDQQAHSDFPGTLTAGIFYRRAVHHAETPGTSGALPLSRTTEPPGSSPMDSCAHTMFMKIKALSDFGSTEIAQRPRVLPSAATKEESSPQKAQSITENNPPAFLSVDSVASVVKPLFGLRLCRAVTTVVKPLFGLRFCRAVLESILGLVFKSGMTPNIARTQDLRG